MFGVGMVRWRQFSKARALRESCFLHLSGTFLQRSKGGRRKEEKREEDKKRRGEETKRRREETQMLRHALRHFSASLRHTLRHALRHTECSRAWPLEG
jgi:hypothetical protein